MGKLKWKCVNNLQKSIFIKLYMSGTAALSAAKNRRTGSAQHAPPGSSKSPQQSVAQQQIQAPKNPLQILYMHELRLNELEKNTSNDKQGNDKHSNDKQSNDNHVINKPDSVNEGIIKTLTDKILLLEKQSYALKDELNKLMSFAMETNRAFLLYKNDKERQEKQEKLELQIQEVQIQ